MSQIREMIENFGERLNSIQLIIKKSVEVSKTQDTETSTTSSSMTVTKKLGKGSRRKHHSAEPKQTPGKPLSRELIKTLTGYDSGSDHHPVTVNIGNPKTVSSSRNSSRSMRSATCPKHSGINQQQQQQQQQYQRQQQPIRIVDAQLGNSSVEVIREKGAGYLQPDKSAKTFAISMSRSVPDIAMSSQSVSCELHQNLGHAHTSANLNTSFNKDVGRDNFANITFDDDDDENSPVIASKVSTQFHAPKAMVPEQFAQ